MLRGVIQLTTNELMLLSEAVAQIDPALSSKCSPDLQLTEPVRLELSHEEAETLLDSLPAPTDPHALSTGIRKKLSEFVFTLSQK